MDDSRTLPCRRNKDSGFAVFTGARAQVGVDVTALRGDLCESVSLDLVHEAGQLLGCFHCALGPAIKRLLGEWITLKIQPAFVYSCLFGVIKFAER